MTGDLDVLGIEQDHLPLLRLSDLKRLTRILGRHRVVVAHITHQTILGCTPKGHQVSVIVGLAHQSLERLQR